MLRPAAEALIDPHDRHTIAGRIGLDFSMAVVACSAVYFVLYLVRFSSSKSPTIGTVPMSKPDGVSWLDALGAAFSVLLFRSYSL